MLSPLALPLLIDGRLRIEGKTGVGTYARALTVAARTISDHAAVLIDAVKETPKPPGRTRRIFSALWPGSKLVQPIDGGFGTLPRYAVRDVYRVAQAHLDIYGRTLPIRIDGPPGIVHWSYPLPIRVVGWHNLYTVHDTIPLSDPDLTHIDPRRHYGLLRAIARYATGVITVSDSSASAIIAEPIFSGLPVWNCGQSIAPGPIGALPAGLVPRGYFLVVGAVEIRKNLPTIIEAYLTARTRAPLVVAGPDGWGADKIAPLFKAPGIVRMPFLPAETIRGLIAGARALVMVSRAEGFGLPIAEAMTLGTPVITADAGAQAEIAGDAAILVPATNTKAIAAAIRRLVADDGLWHDLRQAGLARASAFTPARFAARLAAVYSGLPALLS